MDVSSWFQSRFSVKKLSEGLTVELNATWDIADYEHAFANGDTLRSPPFPAPRNSYFDGFHWEIVIQPDGLFLDESAHVAAFVELHYRNTQSRNSLKGCGMWEEEGIVVNISLALKCENRIFHVQGEDRVRLYPGHDVWFPYFIERNRLRSLTGKTPSKTLTLQLQVTMDERTVVYYALIQDRSCLPEAKTSSEDIVSLWVEGVSIAVNRTVLQKASPIFRAMLSTECYREAESNKVVLRDVPAVTAQQVVDFLTDNDVTGWTLSEAVDLLRVADKYAMNDLREACENFLLEYSGTDFDDGGQCTGNGELTADELKILGEVYNNTRLKRAALQRSGVFCGWE